MKKNMTHSGREKILIDRNRPRNDRNNGINQDLKIYNI